MIPFSAPLDDILASRGLKLNGGVGVHPLIRTFVGGSCLLSGTE